jgi:hypothetical protein
VATSTPGTVDQQPDGGERCRHGEQEVDVHRPAPLEQLRESAAEQQAERGTGAANGAVHAERLRALVGIGERRREDRERRRGENGGEAALHCPGADQHLEAGCGAADR